MRFVNIILRSWLGFMFVYSASLKLLNYGQAEISVRRYDILPKDVAKATGLLLPWIELATSFSLLLGRLPLLGSLLGIGLGGSFAYGATKVLQREVQVPCGCTSNDAELVNKTTVIRGLTIAASSLLLLQERDRNQNPLPPLLLAGGTLFALTPAMLEILRITQHRKFMRAREKWREARLRELTQHLESDFIDEENWRSRADDIKRLIDTNRAPDAENT